MNPIIEQYFEAIELRLIQSPAVVTYQILRREIAPADGKLRVKLVLHDGGVAELFEYVSEANSEISLLKYSFHWQDVQGKLKQRWDNAPHFLNLPHAPHHVHTEDDTTHGSAKIPNMLFVIEQIEQALRQ